MQTLLLDELSAPQIEHLRHWLNNHAQASSLPDTYWLALPDDLLTAQQKEHQTSCGPHCLALVLEPRLASLRLELLVRSRQSLHCACIAMATAQQRAFALNFWDKIIAAGDGHGAQH